MIDSAPLIDIRDLAKQYGGAQPLRIRTFSAKASDALVLAGLDAGAAETFVHLVSGASLPDEGSIRVAGADTREIATDAEWLASLDRFGIVTHRAVFIEKLPVAANMALPLTLAIEPLSSDMRAEVEALARLVQLEGGTRLDAAIATLTPAERLRVHLARALATKPALVLLERPTSGLDAVSDRAEFGRVLRHATAARGTGFVALSDDPDFAKASGAVRLTLDAATGRVSKPARWWWR